MRKFAVILFFSGMLLWLGTATYKYLTRMGSVEGQVLIRKGNDITVFRDQQVFLVRGKVEKKVKFLDEEYKITGKPLEPDVLRLKEQFEQARTEYDTHQMTVNGMEYSGKFKGKTFKKLKNDLVAEKSRLDSLQREYLKFRRMLDKYQESYNSRLGEYMSNYVFYKVSTDDQGLFRFRKVPKGDYFIYTKIDSVINAPIWQFKISVDGNIKVILNQDNIQSLYK